MFIYKITINNQVYIGLDTKESYKQARWKSHCRESKGLCKQSIHKALKEYGIENAKYEIIEDGFTSVVDLAKAEMKYIKDYDSFCNGLNDTIGGDGLGVYFPDLSEEEIFEIRKEFSNRMTEYNNKVKWANVTKSERKLRTHHLHNDKVYAKKSKTLKETYQQNPNLAKSKGKSIKKWQSENKEQLSKQNKINGAKGAEKVSKKIKIITPENQEIIYNSKSEFVRIHGHMLKSIIKKTMLGTDHNGWKGWEIG